MSALFHEDGRARPARVALALVGSTLAMAIAGWLGFWALTFGPSCLEQLHGHKVEIDACGVIAAPFALLEP